jgi:PAS domain S-box-containing protein
VADSQGVALSQSRHSIIRARHDAPGYLRTGEARIVGIGREVMRKRRHGSVFPANLSVSEVQLAKRRIFTGILRDITA